MILMTAGLIKGGRPESRGRFEDRSRLRAVGFGSIAHHSRVEGVEAGGYRQKVSSGPLRCEGGWSLNQGGVELRVTSFHPVISNPRFYSSSAVRPLAPFDSAPPPQFGGAEASVPRPARGTGPNARLRARTRFPPIYLEPNLHAIIASLAGRGVGGGGRDRKWRRGCAVHLPVLLGVVVSFPLSFRTLLPGHRPLGPGGSVRSGPTTGLMVSLTGPVAAPVRSSNHSPVVGRVSQPCGWIVIS